MKYRHLKKNTGYKTTYKDYFLLNYVIIASTFAILLFLCGFFPIKYNEGTIATRKDIPKFIERTRVKLDEVYKPSIKKLVIMVIDALRWDFVSGMNSSEIMPLTTSLLHSNAGCIYKTKVNPPTVTMPRIKAMTTGTVPNFVDVILNLGADEVLGDSILRQTYHQGHKIIFYGDDTWLKLFPNTFHRSQGTTSFYVNDFTEVDDNVTKNLASELDRKDWSIMILHYLGLDHIGHIAGPFSHLVRPKLREMDEIIASIEIYVSEMNKRNEPTLFLVCGDHGMKDSGGHGGATLEETLVPLLAFGKTCSPREKEIEQIDIAPTLSVLLGTPIPSTNLGTIVPELISDFSLSQKLFAFYYNAEQLFVHYQNIHDYQITEAYKNYQNAIKLHSAWLSTNSHPNDMVEDIILMYESAIVDMKKSLTSNLLEYDIQAMTLGTLLLGHILYIGLSTERSNTTYKHFSTVFIASYVIWAFLNQVLDGDGNNVLFSYRPDLRFVLITIPTFGILLLNCYLCATRMIKLSKFKLSSDLEMLLMIGTVLQTLSLSSSSFVEEEHQIWYFYWITVVIFFTYEKLIDSTQESGKIFVFLLLLMFSHRVVRKLNSTGDKYAHLPDISGWLQDQESNLGMTIVLSFALFLLVGIDVFYEDSGHRSVIILLDTFIAIIVYLRHAINDAVYNFNNFESRGIIEIYYFWALVLIYLIHSFHRLTIAMRHNRQKLLFLIIIFTLKKFVIISCLLHRPYNVILLPLQLIVGLVIHAVMRDRGNSNTNIYLYLWSSSAFYFYQGNSNSLATIDVAAGYIGLESYQPLMIGFYLSINTYSAHIIGLLMFLSGYTLQNSTSSPRSVLTLCEKYIFWRLVPMTFYTIITCIQRYHLFVWSVFSPKLLYEAMHCMVLFAVIIILQLNFLLYNWKKARTKCL